VIVRTNIISFCQIIRLSFIHSMPSPPPQHMFEEPPILVEVKGDDDKAHH
jgi:hypothetical protein